MLVSIIVPVYNVEKYVSKCINSLLNQTYFNIEIIVVDDGSTDNSYNIVNEYNDSRIKLYKISNEGLGNARNYGFKKSKGDYICFVDSDDYVSENYIQDFVDKSKNKDIIICNYEIIYDKKTIKSKLRTTADKMISSKNTNLIDSKFILNYRYIAWNKMYSRNILKSFKWGQGAHEDITSILLMTRDVKIDYVESKNYFYLKKDNTLSTTTSLDKINDINKNYKYVYKNLKNDKFKDSIKLRQYCSLVMNYCDLYKYDTEKLDEILSILNKKYKHVLIPKLISNLSFARKQFVKATIKKEIKKIQFLTKLTSK